ncbi:glycosyltransferase [Enterobacter hormaechei]|uniref:glycosyltransferase n=1 Tax=Enterobacter hormaechei TaxID=158836 RepID=UPI000D7E2203|nr:glycosyltransferase [Enterobacter hormaechei]AWS77499.1 glycosyl hydrolase family 1 [Enterobacter cloacae complex sp.]HCJ7642246.1 glycosyltransferase [Enterobacter hormaechei subsp. xiangfangensis]HDW2128098.1 glycosyltransferase [Enterobacter hormaechei subsp. steigerwaltii]AXO46668.1 glycosyltransferase [Enterobacter hormaechei]EKG3234997.1 glycosyltransferase [Enterobacter hormaechei]
MKKIKKLFILHEYGEPSHYNAVQKWANNKNIDVKFVEFSFVHNVYNSLKKKNIKNIWKCLKDYFLLTSMILFPSIKKECFFIVGIAPMDKHIAKINKVLKGEKYIYHTSWLYWEGDNFPKNNNHITIKNHWEHFLSNAKAIACVTPDAAKSIGENFSVNHKTYVVYHSFNHEIFFPISCDKLQNKKLNICFLGRLEKSKGIDILLDVITKDKFNNYIIIGKGTMLDEVIQKACECDNVKYKGFINNKKDIADLLRKSDILLLPSLRVPGWEELFGIALIEAMACGVVPITTDHKGPALIMGNEMLSRNIFPEQNYEEYTLKLIKELSQDKNKLDQLKEVCLSQASFYNEDNISKLWDEIINEKIIDNN